MAQSLIVIRNGKIVAESYPLDKVGVNTFSNIQSSTKSISSILVGIAIQEGLLNSTHTKLVDLYPNLFPDDDELKQITLHHALTMRSGLDFKNSAHTQQLYQEKGNSVQFILNRKRLAAPGERIHYSDGDPHLVSKAIEVIYGENAERFANKYLFKKLGIENYKWEQAKDGTTYGAFALHLTARDQGKIGQLLLNNGNWKGEQIINENYLQLATSHQVYIDLTGDSYGYYFWLYPEMSAFAANGHGGQYLFIAPDKNLVVVYTAWPYTNGNMQDRAMQLIEPIYKACKN